MALTPGSAGIDQAQTVALTATVSNDSKNGGVTWTVSGGGTLTGQTTSAATFNAPASVASAFTATVTATSVSDGTKSATLQIKVSPVPAITTSSAPAGTAGTAYNVTLSESGGTPPYTWAMTSGTLPAGLSFNSSTGVISGTPTGAGNGNSVTFTVTDSSTSTKMTASQTLTFTVNPPAALAITTTSLPNPVIGTAYSATVSATGGVPSYKWSLGGNPAWLSINANTGALSGTPSGATGPMSFGVTVTDSQTPSNATASTTLNITVDEAPAVTSASSTTFAQGAAGSFTVTAIGYPAPTVNESGALPTGVTFNAGVLSGTPTANGTFHITFTASNGISPNGVQNFTLTVTQAPAITSASSTTFTEGAANSFTVTATGFPAPTITESGALPAGVTFNAGVLSGTPTANGTFPITFTASNGVSPNAVQNFTLTVNQAPAITSASSTTFTVGATGSFTVTAIGFPAPTITESGALPNGVTFNAGALSGTPTASGTFPITFTASNGISPNAVQNFTLTVTQAPAITSANSTTFTEGAAGSFAVTATGVPAPTITESGALPAGVTFNAGVLSGTPTVNGTFNLTFTASNGVSPNAVQNFTLTVNQAPVITSASSTTFTVGVAGSFTVTAIGSPAPTITESGALPAGVTFNAGVLSGTPTANGTFHITFTASNGISPNAVQNFTLTVNQAPAITSASSTTFTEGAAGSFTVTATGFPAPTITESGALPTGVTFNAGVLSGTPTANGTFNLTFTASNGVSPNAVQNFTLTVNQAPVITSASSTTFTEGTAGSFSVTAIGFPAPTIAESGALPTGVTFNAGVLSGTPTANGTFPITFTASNGVSPNAVQNFTLTVNQAPAITSANNTTFTLGTASSFTVTATGFPAPTITESGALPSGVTFNAGVLSGTPSVTGTFNLTFTASNGISPNAVQNFTLTVDQAPIITSANSTTFAQGAAGSFTVTAVGFPAPTITESGALPTGVTFNAGVLSGTPSASGSFPITFTASNGVSPNAVQNFTLTVTPPQAPAITSASSTTFTEGVANSFTVTATGSPTPTITESGALPAGVTFNAGVLSGTPTANGTYSITFTAANGVSPNAVQNFTLTVNQAPVITSASSTTFIENVFGSFTVTAIGFPAPMTTESGALPTGVTFNAGVLSGTPTVLGTFPITFTASNGVLPNAVQNFTLTVSAGQAPVITSASSTTFTEGAAGSFTVTATGSPTPTITESGGLPSGVTFNAGVLSGTPTVNGTYNITFTASNGVSPNAVQNFTLNVTQAPSITSPNGTTFVQGLFGSFTVTAIGFPVPTITESGALPTGVTFNAGVLSGTPSVTGTFPITFTASNGVSPNAVQNFTLTVNGQLTITTGSVPNGSVNTQYNATVNASGGVPPYSWNFTSGGLPPGLNSGTNNNSLNISGTPTQTGSYPFTLQVMDSQGNFASQGYTIVISTQPVGYTVSGTVTYNGSKTGWTYLVLNNSNCTGCNNSQGTSISETTLKSGGAFTIHGVQPGTYTLLAFMDNLGYGAQNASNPTGAALGTITVTNSNVTGVSLGLGDPGPVTLGVGPTWKSDNGNGAFNGGAFVSFKTIQNNVGIEAPTSYTVQWSTSSSFGSVLGSKSFPATGNNNPWIINGLTNGQTLYFRAQGVTSSSTSNWSNTSNPMTIGAPTGANTVTGTVTFSETPKGPLYVGFYNQSTGSVYVDVIASPKSPQAYTVQVPSATDYYFFGFLDQNNSGMFAGAGQVSNTNGGNNQSISINGNLSNEDLTLPSGNSKATVQTQSQEQINQNGTNVFYSIGFSVTGVVKLPVGVELTTGPAPGVIIPTDFAAGAFYGNGNSSQFSYYTGLNGAVPHVGDTYTMNVTYSDGSVDNPSVQVSAVLNAFATNLSPQGTGVSTMPTFTWTDPANASNYLYQFQLWDQYGNQIWQIPGNNSNSNGFSSAYTTIDWGVDPTGSGSLPNVPSLTGSSTYYWQITATDANGNSAQVQVTFQTAATPLTLPAPGNVGTVVVTENFNGSINASGGVGPNYTFTVNGSTGQNIPLGDGLYASNTGGSTLSLFGTPNNVQTVTFSVSVTDSNNETIGPYTYTITVTPVSPLVIQTTSLPAGNNGWPYSSYLQASGGGGSGTYTWSIISGSLPSGLSINAEGNGGLIGGTPNTTGVVNFTVQVSDNIGNSATQALSLAIKNCTYTALNGNYAFLVNGWKANFNPQETIYAQATVGSFVANGTGTITSGEVDVNDQNNGVQNLAITGTYCVNSSNLAQISFTASGQSGGATFAAALDSSDGNGHIIRYDGTSSEISSGLLRKQTTSAFSTSKINGNYAFGLVGADSGDNRFAVAGVLNMDGSGNVCKAGTIACEYDYNDGGSGQGSGPGNGTISPSTYSVAANGRGTATINSSNGTTSMVFYVVSASELLMMESDTGSNIEAGQVLLQSGTFGLGSLSGVSVIESQGFDTKKSAADAQAGLLTADGNSNITSATIDENDGGSASSESTSGTYTMASNGRGTFSLAAENNPRVMYMVTKNQAFVVSTGGKTGFGTLTPQSGSNFTNSSLSGNYYGGSQQPVDYNVSSEIDSVNANSGTFSVVSDNSSGGCGGNACVDSSTMSVGYTVSGNGRVIICPAGSGTCTQSNQEGIMYIISAAQVVLLPTSDNNPKLDDFHQ